MLRMSSPFKTPEFKALFQQWNQVLIEDGHEEIEDFTLPDPALIRWHSFSFSSPCCKRDGERVEEIRGYHELAGRLLTEFRFKNDIHRLIWDLHCDGLSIRQIAHELRFWLWDLSKSRIHQVIARIEGESGLKRG